MVEDQPFRPGGESLPTSRQLLDTILALSPLARLVGSLAPGRPLESLGVALDILRHASGAEVAEAFLASGKGMALTALRGPFRHAFMQISYFERGMGFPGIVLAQEGPILTSSLPDDPRYLRTRVKQEGFHSYVCVPIKGHQGILGSLNLASTRPDFPLEGAYSLLSWANVPIATMLTAASHIAEVSRRNGAEEYEGEAGFESLLRQVLRHMLHLGRAEAGALLLTVTAGGVVRCVTEGPLPEVFCPGVEGRATYPCPALARGEGVALYGSRRAWPAVCQHARPLGRVTYCLPLVAGEGVVGLLRVCYRVSSPFPPTRYLWLLQGVAQDAAFAIGEAWKRLEAQRRARALQAHQGAPHPVVAAEASGERWIAPETPPLAIRCFGPFELYRWGKLVTPGAVKRRKVLLLLKVLLAYEGHPVSSDTLMELLWPGISPDLGLGRLHVVVHVLRRLLETPGARGKWLYIQRDGENYVFNLEAPCYIDVQEFRLLVQTAQRAEAKGEIEGVINAYEGAAGLYRGDFLEDEPFSEWCWPTREHLRETYLTVLKRLASLYGQVGRWERAIGHLRQALRVDPLREEAHRELMRSLWTAGRRDEALRQYHLCRDLLRKELGVRPLPETERLAYLIRTNAYPSGPPPLGV